MEDLEVATFVNSTDPAEGHLVFHFHPFLECFSTTGSKCRSIKIIVANLSIHPWKATNSKDQTESSRQPVSYLVTAVIVAITTKLA